MPRKYSFVNSDFKKPKNQNVDEKVSILETEVTVNDENTKPALLSTRRSYSFRQLSGSAIGSVKTVKNAFGSWRGTIKKKIKFTGKAHKRLINIATPTNVHSRLLTPPTSERTIYRREVKMYSPFAIDSPNKTPRRIRMGTGLTRRLKESPGILEELQLTTQAISLSYQSPRPSGIKTTPRCRNHTKK